MTEETKSATHFGEDVFGDEAIRTYLSKDTAKKRSEEHTSELQSR